MPNTKQSQILRLGVIKWNAWRDKNPDVKVDLRKADLRGTDLSGIDLSGADLLSFQ